jgi:hypothetical protein
LSHSRTEEHIFANWFRSLTNHKTIGMYLGSPSGTSAQLKWRPTLARLVVKGVCRKCNNGWMSSLETAVEPIMRRVFAGTDVDQLPPVELETLARWTAKTAITLSYATPQHAPVPLLASQSLHPTYHGPPRFAFFYSKISADGKLDNGHLQVVYGSEVPVVGSKEVAGTRLVLGLNGHCLVVDFPPFPGVRFNLTHSCSAEMWPVRTAAGTRNLSIATPARTDQVLLAICQAITVEIDPASLRA